jgi:hypothetical protein
MPKPRRTTEHWMASLASRCVLTLRGTSLSNAMSKPAASAMGGEIIAHPEKHATAAATSTHIRQSRRAAEPSGVGEPSGPSRILSGLAGDSDIRARILPSPRGYRFTMPTDYRCAPSARRRVMNLPLSLVLSGLALLGMQACGGRGKAVAEAAPVREDVRLLTDEQRAKHLESFDIAWQTIRDGHFDANLNGVDWEAAKAELRPRVEAAKTADDARGAINDLVAKLKQTHFGLIPSDAYERITPKAEAEASVVADASASTGTASGPGVLGVRVRVVNDRALVTRVVEDTPAYSAGVRPGWIIDAINTDPVAPSLKASEHTSGSPALGAAMAARAIESRLDGSLSNTVRVTFTDGNDRSVTHTLQRVAPRGTPARVANLPTM